MKLRISASLVWGGDSINPRKDGKGGGMGGSKMVNKRLLAKEDRNKNMEEKLLRDCG